MTKLNEYLAEGMYNIYQFHFSFAHPTILYYIILYYTIYAFFIWYLRRTTIVVNKWLTKIFRDNTTSYPFQRYMMSAWSPYSLHARMLSTRPLYIYIWYTSLKYIILTLTLFQRVSYCFTQDKSYGKREFYHVYSFKLRHFPDFIFFVEFGIAGT